MSTQVTKYDETEKFKAGLVVRESVLGADRVRKALWESDEFNAPMQQLATEFCWGAVWTRPGLDKKTRSLLNIAMLTALNRSTELETHVRGALVNGCAVEEIQEVLLQAAIYAGVPAGIEGFRVASKVVADKFARSQ
jgi:4-carboxymuconolactone decarboxylase